MNPAYAYIYDDFVSDRRYQDVVAAMETRLAALGISGRIGRLALFRSAYELVQSFVEQGVENIVIVGNDYSLMKFFWFLPKFGVTVGYIPVAEPARTAAILGIPVGLPACEALGARLIERLDIGKIGSRYFFYEVLITQTDARFAVSDGFNLSFAERGRIRVVNFDIEGDASLTVRDGCLDLWMQPDTSPVGVSERFLNRFRSVAPIRQTHHLFSSGVLHADHSLSLLSDLIPIQGDQFVFSVVPGGLRMIVGRSRWQVVLNRERK